ncbi:hypothetical protein M1105_13900 [Limibaculum sp. FT325]|uniref:hypothetical protein n=1 Tax=Thermohalobaculum sediminis TaxID=2939436 RepID=UPI0020BF7528|nr:hypothetical protein [Limibaculum sediminis]MCL5778077.1 hypothetical protein [Limibaculum sediminis]
MGRHAGRLIARRIAWRPTGSAPFRYRHAGSLATIGRGAAVAKVAGLRLSGTPAWLLWAAVHLWFLIGARNRLAVATSWAWSYLCRDRSARLITGPIAPATASALRSHAA